jgi:signal peptidase I
MKRWKRGSFLLAIAIMVLALNWSLRPALHAWAFGMMALGTFALTVFSAWDVGYSAPSSHKRLSQWWLVFLLPAAMAGTSAQFNLGLFLAGTRLYRMAASSMQPAISPGDNMIVDLRCYRQHTPERGDVIIFSQPSEPELYLVKRVVAFGGETIDIQNDQVSVDEVPLDEPYVFVDKKYSDAVPHFHEKVPPGKLFVLGDDRRISLDSRFPTFGLVDVAAVRGKVVYSMPALRKRFKWMDFTRTMPR